MSCIPLLWGFDVQKVLDVLKRKSVIAGLLMFAAGAGGYTLTPVQLDSIATAISVFLQ